MGKYLKVIGFLVLALALWQTSGAAFTVSGAVSAEDSMNIRTVTAAHYPVAYHVPYSAFLYH